MTSDIHSEINTDRSRAIINKIRQDFPALDASRYKEGDMEKMFPDRKNLPARFDTLIKNMHDAAVYLKTMLPTKEEKAAANPNIKIAHPLKDEQGVVTKLQVQKKQAEFKDERRRIYKSMTDFTSASTNPDPNTDTLARLLTLSKAVAVDFSHLDGNGRMDPWSRADDANELFSAILEEHSVPGLPPRARGVS